MPAPPTPTSLRAQLGAELVSLRGTWSQDHVVALLEKAGHSWHKTKISRIENGHTQAAESDVTALLDVYGMTDPDERSRLVRLCIAAAGGNDWYRPYKKLFSKAEQRFLGLEADARLMLDVEPQVIPGPLQTAEYARALMLGAGIPVEEIGPRVEVRMARSAHLLGRPGFRLHAIVDEAALHRQVGGPTAMGRQLAHLTANAGQCTLQVLPFKAGSTPAIRGAFVILGFGDEQPGMGFMEGNAGLTIMGNHDVSYYRGLFQTIKDQALGESESLRLIGRLNQK